MERKIISVDISPDTNGAIYEGNAGVMWEHNATEIVFNIDERYIGDYKYYIEYRSILGTKVRTEYLTLDTSANTITYAVPVSMSSLRGVECYFNIITVDADGNTVQVIKPRKLYLEFDYSPDTDNSIAKVNDFSINALLEAIHNGTFKGDKGDRGEKGEKGDKGDKGDAGETPPVDQGYSAESTNAQSGKAVAQAIESANAYADSKTPRFINTISLTEETAGANLIKISTDSSGKSFSLKHCIVAIKVPFPESKTVTIRLRTNNGQRYMVYKTGVAVDTNLLISGESRVLGIGTYSRFSYVVYQSQNTGTANGDSVVTIAENALSKQDIKDVEFFLYDTSNQFVPLPAGTTMELWGC
ncbi:MAG: collagen-like protein [Candidatus Fimenecus sp.]